MRQLKVRLIVFQPRQDLFILRELFPLNDLFPPTVFLAERRTHHELRLPLQPFLLVLEVSLVSLEVGEGFSGAAFRDVAAFALGGVVAFVCLFSRCWCC